jgi:DNA-binding response OmpR family regulator
MFVEGTPMPLNGEPHGEVSGTEVLKGVPVLVVEDAWHLAKLMSTILEQLDMDVVGPTASAAEARWLVAKQRPEIALVDINLKQDMAYDLVEELHDQGVRVIIVMGYYESPISAAKIAGFVQKPFNPRELIAAMCACARPASTAC